MACVSVVARCPYSSYDSGILTIIIFFCTRVLVVGHLPVLSPGQCFEYTSGSDLASSQAVMKGHFYMAWVPPQSPSARAGDDLAFLNLQPEDKFHAVVAPFSLQA